MQAQNKATFNKLQKKSDNDYSTTPADFSIEKLWKQQSSSAR